MIENRPTREGFELGFHLARFADAAPQIAEGGSRLCGGYVILRAEAEGTFKVAWPFSDELPSPSRPRSNKEERGNEVSQRCEEGKWIRGFAAILFIVWTIILWKLEGL